MIPFNGCRNLVSPTIDIFNNRVILQRDQNKT